MTKNPLLPIQLHLSPFAGLTRTTDLLILNYLLWTAVFTRSRVVSASVRFRDLGSSPNVRLLSQPPPTPKPIAHDRRAEKDDDSVPEFWLDG